MDIVERLRDWAIGADYQSMAWLNGAADEIERLRSMLQNGSPVVEATIQHQAMEIMKLKETVTTLNESLSITSQGNAKLSKQVAELREALIYHQNMTRPITKTFEALARTAKEE